MLTKELMEFGLNEKEAKAYLALLELEIGGVNEIAKIANLNRSSTYVTLESLKKKGLVGISDDKKVRSYVATPPDTILRLAQEALEKQEKIKSKIEKIVPEMKALHKGTKRKPIVKVFEGREGIMNAYIDTLKCKEKLIRISSSSTETEKNVPDYISNYMKKRYELGLKMKGMHPNDEMYNKISKILPKGFDEDVSIPKEKFIFTADLAIYDNKIGYIANEGEGLAITIESKEMAEVMKSLFDLAFEEAKRLNKSK